MASVTLEAEDSNNDYSTSTASTVSTFDISDLPHVLRSGQIRQLKDLDTVATFPSPHE